MNHPAEVQTPVGYMVWHHHTPPGCGSSSQELPGAAGSSQGQTGAAGRKGGQQDSNLESPAPEADASSIRPTGRMNPRDLHLDQPMTHR